MQGFLPLGGSGTCFFKILITMCSVTIMDIHTGENAYHDHEERESMDENVHRMNVRVKSLGQPIDAAAVEGRRKRGCLFNFH